MGVLFAHNTNTYTETNILWYINAHTHTYRCKRTFQFNRFGRSICFSYLFSFICVIVSIVPFDFSYEIFGTYCNNLINKIYLRL